MNIKAQIAAAASAKRETNDCTVRALAVVAFGGNYEAAHNALRKAGRRNRRGMNIMAWQPAFKKAGAELMDCTSEFSARTVRSAEKELARRNDGHKYIIRIRGHVAAWDGSQLIDWAAGRLHRIRNIFRVVPVGTYAPAIVADFFRLDPTDCVYIEKGKREGHWKIMFRENGKCRHLNDAWCPYDAEYKAKQTATKRCVDYAGEGAP